MHNSLSSVQTAGLFVPPFVRPGRLGSGSGYDPIFSSGLRMYVKEKTPKQETSRPGVRKIGISALENLSHICENERTNVHSTREGFA